MGRIKVAVLAVGMLMPLLAGCESDSALRANGAATAAGAADEITADAIARRRAIPLPLPLPMLAAMDVRDSTVSASGFHDGNAHYDLLGPGNTDLNLLAERQNHYRDAITTIASLAGDIGGNDIGGGGGGSDMPIPPVEIMPRPTLFTFEYMLDMQCISGGIVPCPVAMLTGTAVLEIDTSERRLNLRSIDLSSADAEFHIGGMLSATLPAPDSPANLAEVHTAMDFDGDLTRKTGMKIFPLEKDAVVFYGGFSAEAAEPMPVDISLEIPGEVFQFKGTGCHIGDCP